MAYAARLLKRQDVLQAEANRLVRHLDLPATLGRAGRLERLGRSVFGLIAWRDLHLGVSCGHLSSGRAWETVVALAIARGRTIQTRTTIVHHTAAARLGRSGKFSEIRMPAEYRVATVS